MAEDIRVEPAAPDTLEEATRMMAGAQLQFESMGYAPGMVRAAVERARGAAEYKARPISGDIHGRAFLDLFHHELNGAENWLEREKAFIDNEGTDEEE